MRVGQKTAKESINLLEESNECPRKAQTIHTNHTHKSYTPRTHDLPVTNSSRSLLIPTTQGQGRLASINRPPLSLANQSYI